MTVDQMIRFQFNFRGVEVEISGGRAFVEEMYQEIMRDIEAARRGERDDTDEIAIPSDETLVWVHRCSDMMRKIYMATSDDLGFTPFSKVLDTTKLGTVYVDKHIFDRFLPNLAKNHTLWAELTEEGRRTISGQTW